MPKLSPSRMPAGKKVLLFNVKFSENLGDGLIAEALERGLLKDPLIASVRSIDLAGRHDYGDLAVRNRAAKLQVISMVPKAARGSVVSIGLSRKLLELQSLWRSAIQEADHVVIGGGHLFQDDDLNFPSKIGALLQVCADTKVPLSVYSVGVTASWSDRGRELFNRLTSCNVISVSVRDELSRRNWSAHFADTELHDADVSLDPVLSLPAQPLRRVGAGPVGLCIMSPRVLSHHMATGPANLRLGFVSLCRMLVAGGHNVALFTNGAHEDERFLDRIVRMRDMSVLLESARVTRLPRSTMPRELRLRISKLRAVIAHRLHANILAYSQGIPVVGLGWDDKVRSFFQFTGREEFFIPADENYPLRIVELLERALLLGIDPVVRAAICATARADLDALRERIGTC